MWRVGCRSAEVCAFGLVMVWFCYYVCKHMLFCRRLQNSRQESFTDKDHMQRLRDHVQLLAEEALQKRITARQVRKFFIMKI